jgi:hypothetical protein
MTPFIIFLIVCVIIALSLAIMLLIYKKRWWPVIFVAIILLAFIILAYYLPTRTLVDAEGFVTTLAVTGEATLLIPIYIIIFCYGIMFLIVVMVCGSVVLASTPGNAGAVGVLLVAFLFAIVATMPTIYIWYRVFIQASVMLCLGILAGSTILALINSFLPRRLVKSRQYGCQSFSHVLYYFSLAALVTAGSNCSSADDIFTLLAASALAAACATCGIVAESNMWNV